MNETSEIEKFSDEQLFDAIREQVNLSRYGGGHDREKTRELSAEGQRRGWNLRQPSEPWPENATPSPPTPTPE